MKWEDYQVIWRPQCFHQLFRSNEKLLVLFLQLIDMGQYCLKRYIKLLIKNSNSINKLLPEFSFIYLDLDDGVSNDCGKLNDKAVDLKHSKTKTV